MSNISKDTSSKCVKGQIERDGYSYIKKKTKKKVIVPPTCIIDKGKPGKGLKLIKIPDYDIGLLSKYGYTLSINHEKRVESLKKAIKSNSELKILRHLNALRTLHKSNQKLYNKLDKDMKWIQKDYAKKKGGKDKDNEDWNNNYEIDEMEDFEMEEREWWENNNHILDEEKQKNKIKQNIKKSEKKSSKKHPTK